MAGTWANMSEQPGASIDTMLLLTNGTVIAHVSNSPQWRKLTPDDFGSYTSGTWSDLAPMPPNDAIPASVGGPTYGPLFFASAVLGDGTVLVAGGEYNTGPSADVAAATRFDPVTSTWTNVTTPAGWTNVGDAPFCVLADGRGLMGNINSNQTAFFDPVTGTFSAGPDKGDQCSEESFVLLPDGTVLAVDCTSIPNAEKYLPATNEWVPAGSTPSTLPQACPGIVAEIGPTVLLPDGNALTIGASGNTAIYVPPANPSDPGTWQPGPTITDSSGNTMYPIDAPAVLLPNGRVLLTASPAPPCSFPGPTSFFEYDPATNGLAAVTSPSNASGPCFTGRFLLLPNGQVLFSSESAEITIYTPDGTPDPSWKPAISGVPAFMAVGHDYMLSGTQFNGLSQACMYGDDATMATNYPVARLEQGTTVIYCRTALHSTMGVATGTEPVSTVLSIPPAVPSGSYDLVVVANGIASDPVPVTIAAQAGLGDIIELGLAFGGTWQQNNLTAITGTPPAATAPGDSTVASAPFAYITPDGSGRVVYKDGDINGLGDIIELWLPPGAGTWQYDSLTAITGAPQASLAPIALVTPGSVARVIYADSNDGITELWLAPGGTWQHDSLTATTGAPLVASAPFAYVTPDNVTRVIYQDIDSDIIELGLAPGGAWQQNNLTAITGTLPALHAPFAYVTPDGAARVLYQDFNFAPPPPGQSAPSPGGDIIELRLTSDAGTWQQANLTATTGAPQPSGPLFAYTPPDELPRVVYTGNDGHIAELRQDPAGWVHADLTISVSPPAPPVARGLFAYTPPDELPRVLYTGHDGHIIELRLEPDGWVQADLTTSVNNPPAPSAASAPFAYVTPDKVARVYYSSSS
jgi:hypothetical protein